MGQSVTKSWVQIDHGRHKNNATTFQNGHKDTLKPEVDIKKNPNSDDIIFDDVFCQLGPITRELYVVAQKQ